MKLRLALARVLDPEKAMICHHCKWYRTHKIYTHRHKGERKPTEDLGSGFWPLCDKCVQDLHEEWNKEELQKRGIHQ